MVLRGALANGERVHVFRIWAPRAHMVRRLCRMEEVDVKNFFRVPASDNVYYVNLAVWGCGLSADYLGMGGSGGDDTLDNGHWVEGTRGGTGFYADRKALAGNHIAEMVNPFRADVVLNGISGR